MKTRKLGTIGHALVGLIAAGQAHTCLAQDEPTKVIPGQSPRQMVDALHSAFGEHHARAVHAKGLLLTGSFVPAPEAKTLSAAAAFSNGALPVVVRFSDFTGIPDIPDTSGSANPRGLAIKIKAPQGEEFDIVTHSFNGFPTATADEFAAFLRSIGASGPDAPHPNAIERFLDAHPLAKAFVASQKPPPWSYATIPYFGVNALKFTAPSGKEVFVRYRFVPRAGERYLNETELKARDGNYLQDEIATRVAKSPIAFDWYAQVAGQGDAIENPAIAWPESRRLVKLGVVTVMALAQDQSSADKQTLFLPGQPHDGIKAADPMLVLRNNAYPISHQERQ